MSILARLAIEDYGRIVETGVLDGRRVEFIEGRIYEMAPIGSRHESAVDQLTRWSYRTVDDEGVLIRIQQSLGLLVSQSVPEPDMVWVRNGNYTQARPTGEAALLVVEVAETSLEYDLGDKARLYSAAGIREYWVVDCPNRRVVVHREPGPSGFGSVQEFSGSESVSPLCRPGASMQVERLFKPTDAPAD